MIKKPKKLNKLINIFFCLHFFSGRVYSKLAMHGWLPKPLPAKPIISYSWAQYIAPSMYLVDYVIKTERTCANRNASLLDFIGW